MNLLEPLLSSLRTIGGFVIAMVIVAVIELVTPLRLRSPRHLAHLKPNLTLTAITFVTNAVMSSGLVALLVLAGARGFGLLHLIPLPPIARVAIVVVALDLATYLAHVAMHRVPMLWRFHRVHHADPFLDVTSTARQHPGEGIIRHVAVAAVAIGLGAAPAAYAIYRTWSALTALAEHGNIRLPLWLDRLVSLVFISPNMHKVHHSRSASEVVTNYGNILSIWDRIGATFSPSERGTTVSYGIDGCDDPEDQTASALLASPFRSSAA